MTNGCVLGYKHLDFITNAQDCFDQFYQFFLSNLVFLFITESTENQYQKTITLVTLVQKLVKSGPSSSKLMEQEGEKM